MKQVLGVISVLLMVLFVFNLSYADSSGGNNTAQGYQGLMTPDTGTDTETSAADFLGSQGIIVDHKDNPELYELDEEIQRQAVMKIVMKLSGREIMDACRGEFSDVDTNTWPCKYIEAALDAGYIAPNDTFRPFDKITMTEAMKLVLKSKGIQKIQETDNWQEDYMETAHHYGIIEEKYYNYNDNALRGWIFGIATATIEKQDQIFEMGGIISDEADTE